VIKNKVNIRLFLLLEKKITTKTVECQVQIFGKRKTAPGNSERIENIEDILYTQLP